MTSIYGLCSAGAARSSVSLQVTVDITNWDQSSLKTLQNVNVRWQKGDRRHVTIQDVAYPELCLAGATPLHFAAATGQVDAIMELYYRGAECIADRHGLFPKDWARIAGQGAAVDTLNGLPILAKSRDESLILARPEGVRKSRVLQLQQRQLAQLPSSSYGTFDQLTREVETLKQERTLYQHGFTQLTDAIADLRQEVAELREASAASRIEWHITTPYIQIAYFADAMFGAMRSRMLLEAIYSTGLISRADAVDAVAKGVDLGAEWASLPIISGAIKSATLATRTVHERNELKNTKRIMRWLPSTGMGQEQYAAKTTQGLTRHCLEQMERLLPNDEQKITSLTKYVVHKIFAYLADKNTKMDVIGDIEFLSQVSIDAVFIADSKLKIAKWEMKFFLRPGIKVLNPDGSITFHPGLGQHPGDKKPAKYGYREGTLDEAINLQLEGSSEKIPLAEELSTAISEVTEHSDSNSDDETELDSASSITDASASASESSEEPGVRRRAGSFDVTTVQVVTVHSDSASSN